MEEVLLSCVYRKHVDGCGVGVAVLIGQVSEGLVHINDPPLHSRGNFLDCIIELDRRLLDYIVGLDSEMNELVDGSVSGVCVCVCVCVCVV